MQHFLPVLGAAPFLVFISPYMALVISWSTMVTLRVVSSAFLVLGLVLTIFRLAYRIWLRRFWVEDAWAGVAFLCGIATLTSCWTYVEAAGEEGIISFWVYSFTFPSVVWAVRKSILFSIVSSSVCGQELLHKKRGIMGATLLGIKQLGGCIHL